MPKLKVGFIGIGAMGFSHLKEIHLHHSARAEVVAACGASDTNIRRALDLAPDLKIYGDESQLIAADLDAIFIATPNFTHVPLALQVISSGKHLFLEKPIGITAQECRGLLAAAEASDRLVMIGHELRYSPYFGRIRALVQEGAVGQPHLVWCREFRGPFQKKSRDWIEDSRRSGGALVDKNCHHFDLMNWWIESTPKRVCAFGGNAVNRVIGGEHQVIDHATVSFEYASNVRGTLQLCMFAPAMAEEGLEMGVIGDRGAIQTRISQLQLLLSKQDRKEPEVLTVDAKRGEGWGGHLGFSEIHNAFFHAIDTGTQPLTSIRDCIDGTLVAIAAEESIRSGKVVELND